MKRFSLNHRSRRILLGTAILLVIGGIALAARTAATAPRQRGTFAGQEDALMAAWPRRGAARDARLRREGRPTRPPADRSEPDGQRVSVSTATAATTIAMAATPAPGTATRRPAGYPDVWQLSANPGPVTRSDRNPAAARPSYPQMSEYQQPTRLLLQGAPHASGHAVGDVAGVRTC